MCLFVSSMHSHILQLETFQGLDAFKTLVREHNGISKPNVCY